MKILEVCGVSPEEFFYYDTDAYKKDKELIDFFATQSLKRKNVILNLYDRQSSRFFGDFCKIPYFCKKKSKKYEKTLRKLLKNFLFYYIIEKVRRKSRVFAPYGKFVFLLF